MGMAASTVASLAHLARAAADHRARARASPIGVRFGRATLIGAHVVSISRPALIIVRRRRRTDIVLRGGAAAAAAASSSSSVRHLRVHALH